MTQVSKSAVAQIKAKNYVQFLEKLGIRDRILLVGVNYSTKTGKHTCVIHMTPVSFIVTPPGNAADSLYYRF